MNVEYMGNKALLGREMTAFLAPSHVSPLAVLPTLDWASEMSRSGRPVVSGFTSRLEKEVWSVLARNHSPMVAVLVRSKYKQIPARYLPLLESGVLLLVFLGLGTHLSRKLAARRNDYVASLASHIVFPSVTASSMLFPLYQGLACEQKDVKLLVE